MQEVPASRCILDNLHVAAVWAGRLLGLGLLAIETPRLAKVPGDGTPLFWFGLLKRQRLSAVAGRPFSIDACFGARRRRALWEDDGS